MNDTYGHDVGDRVLQHFSRRLKKNNIRNKDRKNRQTRLLHCSLCGR
ncbi:diguanylate cyclase [Vibrio sinaloensis]|nr:diguanylate cyclase [Vibrio sinaloensis]